MVTASLVRLLKVMEDQAISQFLESVEVLKAVKSLFSTSDPYLPVYSALGGAFIGAVSTVIPNVIRDTIKNKKEKRSITVQLYSEISALLDLNSQRGYLEHLDSIIQEQEKDPNRKDKFEIQFPENRFPIFNASLSKLGIIDTQLQIMVVQFYQLAESFVQDAKPGGLMNVDFQGTEAFIELREILVSTTEQGNEIINYVDTKYGKKYA